MAKRRSVTSTDIAREAGVSRATVSVVLNETQSNIRVSEATRRRVRDAAAKLHYAPNPAAQALRRQRSRAIAFVPRTMHMTAFGHPIAYQLSLHASRAAARRGYHVIEISPEPSPGAEGRESEELFAFILSRRPDGVLFDAPTTPQAVERVVQSGIPVVQLIRPHFEIPTPTVTVDATQGINDAVDHLVSLGHRHVAYLGSTDTHPVYRSRLESFRVALARHGVRLAVELVALDPDHSLEAGIHLARTMLACRPLPTAFFTASDIFAVGVLHALHEARIRVPDDVSLISYDDVYAPMLYPPITSVAQPLKEVAEHAIDLLVRRIEQPDDAPGDDDHAHIVLPTCLHVRQSTCEPRLGNSEQEGLTPLRVKR